MADEIYRQRGINPKDELPEEGQKKLEEAQVMRKMASDVPDIQVTGSIPPAFQRALEQQGRPQESPRQMMRKMRPELSMVGVNEKLEKILEGLQDKSNRFEPIDLPSKGKFYKNIPGNLHIRLMTGEEEQILATPRNLKHGIALNKIFSNCIKEQFNPDDLLSVDRMHLLIFLRGISYSPNYDVEIKCPACNSKFETTINLNSLDVNFCPEDFDSESLTGTLPSSGLNFSYRLSTGSDEREITEYREKRIKMFGGDVVDDSLTHQTALLVNDIEGIADKQELNILIKNLPISDVNYLRNLVSDPPFGVNKAVDIICPMCIEPFQADLPIDVNFFFPRQKKEKVQN